MNKILQEFAELVGCCLARQWLRERDAPRLSELPLMVGDETQSPCDVESKEPNVTAGIGMDVDSSSSSSKR